MLFFVKVTGIIGLVGKLGKIGPQRMWQASKPTYIYWWAHEVESSRHIGLKNARISGEFWETTKSYRLPCKWLFLLVKVTGIIGSVAKLSKIVPGRFG